jgi:hypothetical protein
MQQQQMEQQKQQEQSSGCMGPSGAVKQQHKTQPLMPLWQGLGVAVVIPLLSIN